MGGDAKNILIVTGEASGDLHGSNLVKALLAIDPSVRVYGVGGKRMEEAGLEILFDAGKLAVVGIVEVVRKTPAIIKAFKRLKEALEKERPDIVVLIDYPGFNLRFAREAKKRGIPVVYYISPQVWAWRKGRSRKIAGLVDKMLVIFPFEVPIYEEHGIDVEYVGHPLADEVRYNTSTEEIKRTLHLDADAVTISLLPGSREEEIARLLPAMCEASVLIKEKIPDVQFVLPLANTLEMSFVLKFIESGPVQIKVVEDRLYDVLTVSDCAVITSGTATLEAAFMAVPMVIVYKVSPITYLIGKAVVEVQNISLPNITAGKRIVSELIQGDATPEKITEEIFRIIGNESYREEMRAELQKVRQILGKSGASERVASVVYEMLNRMTNDE